MALQLDLHIMPARGVTSSLVRGKDDTNALPTLAIVQGDIGVARLRFYSEDRALGTVTQLDRGTDSFVFTGRLASNLEAEKLFEADSFTRVDGGAGDIYYEGALTLSTETIAAALAGKTEVPILCEVESAGPGSLARFPATLYREIARTGPAPASIPSYPAPSQLATKADLDALRGGVPLTGWANSTAHPFGTCTITGGIPSALEFAGTTDDFAYAELSLTDFAPDTLDISGTVSAGPVELTDLSLVFLDSAGAEAGTIGALTLGAAFSFASVVVPAGAVKVAVKALGTAATSSLSTGFAALSVTAHANLSELTAEALDDILADKAQAEADAQTVAALVTPAQTNAQTIADLVAPAQTDRAAIEAARAGLSINATTTTAGVVLLAGGPDETANPGSTKVLTAGDFYTAGVTLTDSAGGQMVANEFYANVIEARSTPGLRIADAGTGWSMQIGTGTPLDTVVDGYGVGSSYGDWRVGGHDGSGIAMRFDDGTYPMQMGSGLVGAMSEGFLFTDTGDGSTAFFGMDSGTLVAAKSNAGVLYIGPGYVQLTAETGGTLQLGDGSGSYVKVGEATGRLSFFGTTPVVKQTGTPANATDLATAIALVNNLKAKLIAYGLIA